MVYIIRIIDKKTKIVVQEETRKTYDAAYNLWHKAMKNVNQLKYKMEFIEK
mgnify:FL=1